MRTLAFGAGPLGVLYAHLRHQAGVDVTILARGSRFELIEKRELELVDGFNGERATSGFKVIDQLLVRKNKIPSVLETLADCPSLENILFMGNNVLGFAKHAEAARDEFELLANEFRSLSDQAAFKKIIGK